MNKFDVVVVGLGHAGCEAALACARLGLLTAAYTFATDKIARMSCNPAIGGIGKGQIVREIDALGGEMARAADATGIQFKILNTSKGPAVQSPRCQSDKFRYHDYMREAVLRQPGLELFEGAVRRLIVKNGRALGIVDRDGREVYARAVILATGTFLNGVIHIGEKTYPSGREDEPPAIELAESLRATGLKMLRFKTGTPPRLDVNTLDLDSLERQSGDPVPKPFSFMNSQIAGAAIDCWVTETNERTHRIIRDNVHRAPVFNGRIASGGPRYCPSIETKIFRFPDKNSHAVYLEPEGLASDSIYVNGVSTSLPEDVQVELFRSIRGLENARFLRYAYAIEYDTVDPLELRATLETKKIAGLFLAGQLLGTSGYEEAAGLGLAAALNAAASISGREPLIFGRDEAYLGVMIDDLTARGVGEPYRMFTSRAEYRLLLRSDNADLRLTPIGRERGLVDDERWRRFTEKTAALAALQKLLTESRRNGKSALELLRRPEIGIDDLAENFPAILHYPPDVREELAIMTRYAGFIERQREDIERERRNRERRIPPDLGYDSIPHLRAEARERFAQIRPETFGQAARISGITAADISVLSVYLARSGGAG